MSGFKYELTQILTLIYKAKQDNLITDDERKAIKEHIITSEPDHTVEMEKYNKDQDLGALVETLKLSAGLTAMSSPLDSSLLKKKKQNQRQKKRKNKKKKKSMQKKKMMLD